MRIASLIVVLILMFAATAIGEQELRIYNWSEYMDEEKMPADFEKKFGIKVRLDIFENNEEMVAKLQAGGAGQYDIIVPSDYIMPVLIGQKLIQPLDHAKLPNLKNLKPEFRNTGYDPGNQYSVAYQWGTVGLMYRKDKVDAAAVRSWSVLFDPQRQPGPFWLIDGVREMMGIALVYEGKDFNSTVAADLKAAADLLVATKRSKHCLGFKPGVGGKNDVVAGTAVAAIVYNGDAIQSVSEDPQRLGFVIPQEGSEIWLDSMCIPSRAPNPDAAHKWINWLLEPEVGAELSNYNQYATPNAAAEPFINPEDLNNPGIYPTPEIMQTLHFTKDLGEANRIMDAAWTRAKSR